MAPRPVSLSVVGWLFVAVGLGGIARHGWTFLHASGPGEAADLAWAGGSGALALIGGAFLLRGHGWARWVLAFWMAGHIVLSAMHTTEQLLVHLVIFTPITWVLFARRPPSHDPFMPPPEDGSRSRGS